MSRLLAVPLAAAALLAAPAGAGAAFDFGSNLASPPVGPNGCAGPVTSCTQWNSNLHPGNIAGTLSSPIDGVVVSFTLSKASGTTAWDPLHLRVVRSAGGGLWAGFGASSPDVVPSPAGGFETFGVRVPISAGDLVGIEQTGFSSSGYRARASGGAVFGAAFAFVKPMLPSDGSAVSASTANLELLLRARVEPDADHDGFGDETQDCPSQASTQGACISAFKFGKLKRNRKKGIAFLFVTVPGPGKISLEGKGVKQVGLASTAARASLAVAGPVVKLKIKPGKGKHARRIVRKLRDKGKAKLKIRVTYVPTGGTANTKTRKVKLVRR